MLFGVGVGPVSVSGSPTSVGRVQGRPSVPRGLAIEPDLTWELCVVTCYRASQVL